MPSVAARTASTATGHCGGGASATSLSDGRTTVRPRARSSPATPAHTAGPIIGLWTRTHAGAEHTGPVSTCRAAGPRLPARMSRFAEPQDPAFQALNASIAFDQRLWPHDLAQSRAHARMLAARDIIGDGDRDALLEGLDAVERELAEGTFAFAPDDEDIHMAIERRLTEIAGPVGGKLHTARSRNDQVATDVALFTRQAAERAIEGVERLARVLLDAAEAHIDWPMPGYTHLQRAQPVYLSHHLLAYVWMLVRDRERFR